MEEHYTVSIVEQSYKDNWESGEIEGTFQSVDLNDGHVFETPQEALRYFYNNYRGDLYGVYMIDDGPAPETSRRHGNVLKRVPRKRRAARGA